MTPTLSFFAKTAFYVYGGALQMATPFLRRHKRLADRFNERILADSTPHTADIWLHAASTGEAFLAVDLANALLQTKPDSMILTTQTEQGRSIFEEFAATHTDTDLQIRYLPLDTTPLMDRFVKVVNPKVAIILETELWPAMLRALKQNGTKLMIANGRMTERSFRRLGWLSSIWKALAPDQVLAISENDANRFTALFGCPVKVLPNIKFDQLQIPAATINIAKKEFCAENVPLVVLGSVRNAEIGPIEKIVRQLLMENPKLVIALFPKHIHQLKMWETMLRKLNIPFQYRSQMSAPAKSGTVILGDTIGELKSIYAMADAVFVGGSLAPLGGQNFLEPLLYGRTPIIGPFWDNFKWVGQDLFTNGLVKIANDSIAVCNEIKYILANPDDTNKIQKSAQHYFAAKQGSTHQTAAMVRALMTTS